MKDDQIVRIACALSLIPIYYIHVGVNGGEAVHLFGVGTVQPFTFVATFELMLAFPELVDRLPFGPSKEK